MAESPAPYIGADHAIFLDDDMKDVFDEPDDKPRGNFIIETCHVGRSFDVWNYRDLMIKPNHNMRVPVTGEMVGSHIGRFVQWDIAEPKTYPNFLNPTSGTGTGGQPSASGSADSSAGPASKAKAIPSLGLPPRRNPPPPGRGRDEILSL